jgi:glutaredoxin-related protein
VKEFLSENNVKFAFIDITESMFNLKMYLKYRDNRPEFEEFKKNGKIGIPFISINKGEKLIFDKQPDLNELRD